MSFTKIFLNYFKKNIAEFFLDLRDINFSPKKNSCSVKVIIAYDYLNH